MFTGEVHADRELDVLSKELKVPMLGKFKSYFVAKMLHASFAGVRFTPCLGPNLAPDRESGAFGLLFQEPLHEQLPAELQIDLLGFIHIMVKSVLLQNNLELAANFLVDDCEHALCEWVKARRNRTRRI
jgi:hypothetical protein